MKKIKKKKIAIIVCVFVFVIMSCLLINKNNNILQMATNKLFGNSNSLKLDENNTQEAVPISTIISEKVEEPELSSEISSVNTVDKLKEALKVGGTIYISNDIEVNEELNITLPTKIISKDKVHTLVRNKDYKGNLINVKNESLVLENIIIDGLASEGIVANRPLVIVSAGNLFLKNGAKITNNFYKFVQGSSYYGSGLYIAPNAEFTMLGGEISENLAEREPLSRVYGAGIYADKDSSITINGGEIKKNEIIGLGYGGGIYNYEAAKFVINGGSISNNLAVNGGGIYNDARNGGSLIITGGTISNNTARYTEEIPFQGQHNSYNAHGGGIFNSHGNINIIGGIISNNIASAYEVETGKDQSVGIGGGIASNGGTINIKNGNINHNQATPGHKGFGETYSYGGGIAVWNKTLLTFESGVISENEADYGGGVYASSDETMFNMIGGKVDKNLAHHQGGGLYVWKGGTLTVSAGYITNNTCDATPSLDYSNFGAGGIMVEEGGYLFLGKTLITKNTAIDTGEEPVKKPAIDTNGAAIAGCPTSDIKINGNNFAIFDNAKEEEVEVSVATAEGAKLSVSSQMLGGGEFNWDGTAPESSFMKNSDLTTSPEEEKINSYLNTNPEDNAKEIAQQNAEVFIMNNTTSAAGGGAAIGTNGYVGNYSHIIIGKEVIDDAEVDENELYEFNIWFWYPNNSSYYYDTISSARYIIHPAKAGQKVKGSIQGEDSTSGEISLERLQFVNDGSKRIYAGKASFKLAAGETIEFMGSNYKSSNDEYCWDRYCDEGVEFYVQEILKDGWTVDWTKEFVPISKDNIFALRRVDLKYTAVNKPLGSLTIEKQISNGINYNADEIFNFHLKLKNNDGTAYTKPIEYEITDGKGKVNEGIPVGNVDDYESTIEGDKIAYPDEGGEINFSLNAKQQVTFKNLPMGTTYKIIEESKSSDHWLGALWSTSGDSYQADITSGSGIIGKKPFSSVKWVATNYKEGTLVVSKKVVGSDDDKKQSFPFKITLSEKINGKYGDVEFVDGIATFNLKDGESKIISNLKSGIDYVVEEIDSKGFKMTSTGSKGSISADNISRAEFVNTKETVQNNNKPNSTNSNNNKPNPGKPKDDETITKGDNQNVKVPKTGDSVWVYMVTLLGSLILITLVMVFKLRNKKV